MIEFQLKGYIGELNFGYNAEMEGYMNLSANITELNEIKMGRGRSSAQTVPLRSYIKKKIFHRLTKEGGRESAFRIIFIIHVLEYAVYRNIYKYVSHIFMG